MTLRAIPSVLVVDDHIQSLEVLSSLLSGLGAKSVCRAESAERALEILKNQAFTVIISDYRLEGMDGVQFLEQLRARGDQTPVLLLSGAPDKPAVIRATGYQKVDFFGKPFRVAELVGALERLVEAA